MTEETQMVEETLCSSQPDFADSILQEPKKDLWSPADLQCINGEQEALVWSERAIKIHEDDGKEPLNHPPKGAQETPEHWEQIMWPVQPMTCTTASLSFATVQWDMPDNASDTPSPQTDSSLANVMSLGTTSPSLHHCQGVHAELFTQDDSEEQDPWLFLSSAKELTGSSSKPCDAVDVLEPATQEEDDSTHTLLKSCNNETEEDEGHSATSDSVDSVVVIDVLEEAGRSEDRADSIVDLRPEEEREEPEVLLTEQTDSEEEQTSVHCVEAEEENEDEEEQSVTNLGCTEETEEENTVSCLCDLDAPEELQQTDDTKLTLDPDEPSHLQQSDISEESQLSETEEELHEGPEGQSEEPELCKEVYLIVDPEVTETAQQEDANEEPLIQEAVTERRETSQVILELNEKPELTGCLGHQDCDLETSQDIQPSLQTDQSDSEQLGITEESEQIQEVVSHQAEEQHCEDSLQLGQLQHLGQAAEMQLTVRPGNADQLGDSSQLEQTVCAEDSGVAEQQEESEASEQNEQTLQTTGMSQPTLSEQVVEPQKTDVSEIIAQLSPEAEVTQQTAELNQQGTQAETPHQAQEVGGTDDGSVRTVVANGEQSELTETLVTHMNGGDVDREMACRLADRLYSLDGIQRADVVKHIDKDNDFSRAVGEEYLRFFDFTGQSVDHALRSFLKVVILIGETQERERVLQHFTCRFHQCNPASFSSSGPVLALTCALMLLNTDLHGQNVGKSMSSSKFVSNLDGMNEGENFSKDLLRSLYNSIRSEPLEWAVDEAELKSSVLVDDDTGEDAPLRSKSNPFQDVPHDRTAPEVKQGFLQRKLHADIDGKRTPWGKRSWKTFYGVLKGMVIYLQKNDCRREQQINEEVVSVHHSLAEQAAEYHKKPHVFRLQTADWRVFLFQASSNMEMNSWISRINLVAALHSSPPFPAAVGSQRRFCRPILPASHSAHTLERQLQSHAGMLESFKADLTQLQQNPPEGRKAKAKELEEQRVRAEYLQYEVCRYETYIQVLEAWKAIKKTGVMSTADLSLFDKAMCGEDDEEEEGRLKKSHSSPSLDLEMAPPTLIKVRRNISERRTYRRIIIPRRNKEA